MLFSKKIIVSLLLVVVVGLSACMLNVTEISLIIPFTQDCPRNVPGEIIVRFPIDTSDEAIDDLEKKYQKYELNDTIGRDRFVSLSIVMVTYKYNLDLISLDELIKLLNSEEIVLSAYPAPIIRLCFTPNDQYWSEQWNMKSDGSGAVSADRAWRLISSLPNNSRPQKVVAVIDREFF